MPSPPRDHDESRAVPLFDEPRASASKHAVGIAGNPRGTWWAALLWALVALQMAIPSAYYFGRGDPEDERFAWRMFSAIRFRHCEVTAFERTGEEREPIHLPHALHASWLGSMRRGRQAVIEKFARGRCVRPGVREVLVERACVDAAEVALPNKVYLYDCQRGARGGDAWR